MNHPAMRAAHFTTSDTVILPILRCGWGSSARSKHHFPMQNRLKITPSRSSAVTAPVIRPRA